MRKPFLFMAILFVLLSTISASAAAEIDQPDKDRAGVITLYAEDVTSAADIENAMIKVTKDGARPGKVILDGKHGPFVYTAEDRSINIFTSNATFRGINNAMFTNCADGFFFDDLPSNNVRIEGLTMRCENSFVVGGINKRNITIQRNTALTPNVSISVNQGEDWVITNNTLETQTDCLILFQGKDIVVSNNEIRGYRGLVLQGTAQSHLYANTVSAVFQGISIEGEARKNQIKDNVVLGVSRAGVNLDPTVANNHISRNTVVCLWGADCQTIFAAPETAEMNFLSNNIP